MKTVVVNKRISKFDVDITQISPIYGNPFAPVRDEKNRAAIVAMFEQLMERRLAGPDAALWRTRLEFLRGKRLGCVCRPRRCHGDVYVRLLETVRSTIR